MEEEVKCVNCGQLLEAQGEMTDQGDVCPNCGASVEAPKYVPDEIPSVELIEEEEEVASAQPEAQVEGPGTPDPEDLPEAMLVGPVQEPSPPIQPWAVTPEEEPDEEHMRKVVLGTVLVVVCTVAQALLRRLLGFGLFTYLLTQVPLAAAALFLLVWMFSSLRTLAGHYVELAFNRFFRRQDLRPEAASAGDSLVLLTYLAVLYKLVLPHLLFLPWRLFGYHPGLLKAARISFALVGIALVVKLVLAVYSLFSRQTGGDY
jgi:predicted  nucleic acid-binding Zn-ribbon protein